MYNFDPNLNLSHLIGKTLIQIGIGENEIVFSFNNDQTILVSGKWEMMEDNKLIDQSCEHSIRKSYMIHGVLGKAILSYEIVSKTQLNIELENSFLLKIYDDSIEYESCFISPDIII